MTKLATVVVCVGAPSLAEESIKYLKETYTPLLNTVYLVDNGSTRPLEKRNADVLHRFEENHGFNGVIHEMLDHLPANTEYVAYMHCDFMIREKAWDIRVLSEFMQDPLLAVAGFIGSNQIDFQGGRGSGTASNFLGENYPPFGQCAAAEVHGRRNLNAIPTAVFDPCIMIFRISQLRQLTPQKGKYAPHHFYERNLCCEVILNGWHMLNIGIACDHLSGGIAEGINKREEMFIEWLNNENLAYKEGSADQAMYNEAERRFLGEYRDQKKLVPFSIDVNYNIRR